MPLLDHFHPPLFGRRHWESLHGRWAAAMYDRLNDELLPPEYFAEMQVTLGTRVEVDIATLTTENRAAEESGPGGVATALETKVWAPPTATAVMPAVFPDDMEVLIFDSSAGPTLVGAIELVSPGNKDRDDTRRAFAAKCAAYLQRGIGLIIVDIVTSRHFNLHDELVTLLGHAHGFRFETETHLYATAYRPAHRQERNEIDLWRETLSLGQPLPTLPLAVRGLGCLPIDLDGSYMEACNRGRIG
jgi:Protein of unknown function (DUF4058)